MGKRWIATVVLGASALIVAQGAGPGVPSAAVVAASGGAAPSASIESGRYVGAQVVELAADAGAEIRYTLDGTLPTRASALYEAPVTVSESANLTAVAFTDRGESRPVIRGILIKTEEAPLAQFAVMSDIHLSSDSEDQVVKWQSYFDTLQRVAPVLDAIVSNGDQINDNDFDSASDHRYPRAMLEQNLERTGMVGTDVLMTFGNHDDLVTRMAEQYPDEWFPGDTGYYEAEIGGFPAFVVNTEAWNAQQAGWLYARLTELSNDPATAGAPVFVFGHRPLPDTVWDGAQASNAGLRSNLADFPQVVYFSGHSHLNISDERSIHQESFTSINEGSMSYEEIDSMYQAFGAGLAREHTVPTAQSVVVEVYGDRVEVDRINYAADAGRTYDDTGAWSFQKQPPFASTGTLAGPSWVIGRGEDPQAVQAGFTYTAANRNAVAPDWGDAAPTVRQTVAGPVLRLPQARDDQFVNDYTVELRDLETGAVVELIPAGQRLYAEYVVAPRPSVLDVPLAVREGGRVGGTVQQALVDGRAYEATLIARDSYGNESAARAIEFVAGALDRTALDAVAARVEELAATIERVLGATTPAEEGDYGYAIADAAAAEQLVADARGIVGAEPATQDAVDAAALDAEAAAVALERALVAVDRAGLVDAIARAEAVLEGAEGAGGGAADDGAADDALRDAIAEASGVVEALNRSQAQVAQLVAQRSPKP